MNTLPKGTILFVENSIDLKEFPAWDIYDGFEPELVGNIRLGFEDFKKNKYYKKWENIRNLSMYPELKEYVFNLFQELPKGTKSRELWETAYDLDTLPNIQDLFIAIDYRRSGWFVDGSVGTILHTPMIEHTENTVKPMGISSVEEPKDIYSPVSSYNLQISDTPANFLLLAQRATLHNLKELPMMVQTGEDCIGYPNHITMNVYINTQTYYPYPDNLIPIIKIEEGTDAPFDINEFLHNLTDEQLALLKGEKGDKGDNGLNGLNGRDGKDFKYEDFTQEQLNQLKGEKGDKGDNGDTKVFVAKYNQTTAQELLAYINSTNEPFAPILVERNGQYYSSILFFKQSDDTAYIRVLGSASGEYCVFNYTVKNNNWTSSSYVLQAKLVSGSNIKTINNQSLLGNGNIDISEPDLSNYYNKTETNNLLNFKANKSELNDYATHTWVNEQNYLKEHQSLNDYAKKSEIPDISNKADKSQLNGLASQSWVNQQGFLKEHQDLSSYAKTNDVNTALNLKADKTQLNGLATENWVNSQNFLKTHQDISNLATKTELATKQNKLTSGSGIKIENNVISSTFTFDPNDHFKLYAVSEDNITINSGSRVNKQLQIQNLPAGFQIVAYKQVAIEKASQETNAEAFHKVYIQTFSTAGNGTKANVSVVNTNSVSTKIKLVITCLVMKIS